MIFCCSFLCPLKSVKCRHVSVSVHVNERAAEQFAKNYAPDVVILQPKRLRDKLRDDLKKAWEAYED